MLNKDQVVRELNRPTAHSHFNEQSYGSMSDFDRTKRFHEKMGLMCNDSPIMPSVSDRILRAKLLLEETIETIEKGLGLRLSYTNEWVGETPLYSEMIGIMHEEGSFYDPVETLDGLADVKVIAEGTAVAFGLPLEEASYEVYCSNMTKLDGNGNPIVNRCKHAGPHDTVDLPLTPEEGQTPCELQFCNFKMCGVECNDESHLIDPTKPKGKLLKSEFYVPANIARVLVEAQSDQLSQVNIAQWLLNQAR